ERPGRASLEGCLPPRSRCRRSALPSIIPRAGHRGRRSAVPSQIHRGGDVVVIVVVQVPGHIATFDHLLKDLPVPERIHGTPKSLISVGHKLSALDETLEVLHHQFVPFSNVVEYLAPEDEIPAIDPDLGFPALAHPAHGALRVEFGEMKRNRRMNGDEAADHVAPLEAIDHVRERSIGESVAVIGKKYFLVMYEMAYSQETLTDVAPYSRVHQRNAPVRRPFAQQLDLRTEMGDGAISARRLLVVQK